MLAKLALRNVKRQVGNYLIYFITVTLTVALMFAINNVIYSTQLQERAQTIQELKPILTVITVFITLIVAFVLGYATSFMLKLRKREFGTYLTLGMTRKNILTIFVMENLIMGAAALGTGILAGLFLYQGMMQLLVRLMEFELSFAAYSVNGLILTIVLVAVVFVLASCTSAAYLKKVSIFQLIHGEKKVEKEVKHPAPWVFTVLISAAAMAYGFLSFDHEMEEVFRVGSVPYKSVMASVLIFAAGIICFHIGLARSLVFLLLRNKKFAGRGTNTFLLRQLGKNLGTNAVMAGILAFLLSFAIIGANLSFVQKVSEQLMLDQEYPFDIVRNENHWWQEAGQGYAVDEAESIIEGFVPIENKLSYSFYSNGERYLYGFTKWGGDDYVGLDDVFMKESDYRMVYTKLGLEPVSLDGGFLILASNPLILNYDFSDARLQLNGVTLPFTQMLSGAPLMEYSYFVAVIPDEAAEGLMVVSNCYGYDVADLKYDAAGLRKALTYQYRDASGDVYDRCDYRIKEYGRISNNEFSAIFVLASLYAAIVFVFMAMAVLALKTLSGFAEDRVRYGILFRLGTGRREQGKTLYRQISGFFFLPFVLPIILSVPVGAACIKIMTLGGFPESSGQLAGNAAAIAVVTALIYLLYFMATYLTAKRTVLEWKE